MQTEKAYCTHTTREAALAHADKTINLPQVIDTGIDNFEGVWKSWFTIPAKPTLNPIEGAEDEQV